jgi:hypothetical protein
MPDEPTPDETETPPGGVVVGPIMDYEPEPATPEPEPDVPMGPPTGEEPQYPVPGEIVE